MSSEPSPPPPPAAASTSSADGWGFDSDDWSSFNAPTTGKTPSGTVVSHSHQTTPYAGPSGSKEKQELLQKRREERRLKQQAAKEKRAASAALKPSGLGAVKKE